MEQRKNTGNQRDANAFLRNLDNIWFRGKSALVGIFPLNSSPLSGLVGWLAAGEQHLSEPMILAAAPSQRKGLAFGDGIAIATATRQDVTDSQV